ncbi:MAG: rod shape-determining protein MreC [Thermodesulfobacteriota bacterium]
MFTRKTATIFILIVLFVVFSVVVSVTDRGRAGSRSVETLLLSAIAPLSDAASRAFASMSRVWSGYFGLVNTAQENEKLKRDLTTVRQLLIEERETTEENKRLKALLSFTEKSDRKLLAARVVGEDPSAWFRSVVINRGKNDGVKEGAAVVTPLGVVGRVLRASGSYSLVLLLLDPNHAVDVRFSRSRARGVMVGARERGLRVKYVLKKEDVKKGDLLVTSGLDGVFPPGIPAGVVAEASRQGEGMFQDITVLPFVSFDKLEEVLVVQENPEPPSWEGP